MADSRAAAMKVDWERFATGMRVVKLTAPLAALVPALALPALSKSTRAMTLFPGRTGLALGAVLMVASAAVAYMLVSPTGVVGPALSVWILGTTGAALFASGLRPTAFVKSICVSCRLLPVIREHEAIHLAGVYSEKGVWDSMKTRHSVESLALNGDPAICPFCPIPKRLSGE